MANSGDRLAIIYALIAVLMWSTVATAFKLSLQLLSVVQLLTGASVFSLLVLTVCLSYRGELITAFRQLFDNFFSSLLFSLCNPVIYYLVLLKAYALLPAQIAQSLNYTWAISLTLLSIPLLKHKVTGRDTVAIIMGYAGVVCIIFSTRELVGSVDWVGIALALVSTLIWAGYWLMSVRDQRAPLIKLFHSFLLSLPCLLLMTWAFDDFSPFLTMTPWPYVIYIGLFEMGLAFIFWQLAMQQASRVSRISTLIFLSPIISLVIINRAL